MSGIRPDSAIKKTRKFDGETYRFDGTRYSHIEALREARRLRKTGLKVRVVQLSYKSVIYVRKGR